MLVDCSPIRPGEDPSVKTSQEALTRGVVVTYVDDLLLIGWQHHIDAITKALFAKYVMKRSGLLPICVQGKPTSGASEGIDFLRARITRDADGTLCCDQSKYIQRCLRENGFYDKDGHVALRKAHAPPSVDEKLGEEEGSLKEKNDAMAMCRKCIGQMMWLTQEVEGAGVVSLCCWRMRILTVRHSCCGTLDDKTLTYSPFGTRGRSCCPVSGTHACSRDPRIMLRYRVRGRPVCQDPLCCQNRQSSDVDSVAQ